jgi:hypothetical protein
MAKNCFNFIQISIILVRSVLIIIVKPQQELFKRSMASSISLIRKAMMRRIRTALSLLMMDMTSSKKVSSKIVTKKISSKKNLRQSRKEKRR